VCEEQTSLHSACVSDGARAARTCLRVLECAFVQHRWAWRPRTLKVAARMLVLRLLARPSRARTGGLTAGSARARRWTR